MQTPRQKGWNKRLAEALGQQRSRHSQNQQAAERVRESSRAGIGGWKAWGSRACLSEAMEFPFQPVATSHDFASTIHYGPRTFQNSYPRPTRGSIFIGAVYKSFSVPWRNRILFLSQTFCPTALFVPWSLEIHSDLSLQLYLPLIGEVALSMCRLYVC